MSIWQHGETGRLVSSDERPGHGWYQVPDFFYSEGLTDPHTETLMKPSVEQKPMAMPKSMFPMAMPP